MDHQPNLEHYKLDRNQKTQIAFSGGRSSGFQLYHIIQANPWLCEETWKGDESCVQILFNNTALELEETYEFVKRCGDEWGVNVRWLEYTLTNPENLPLDTMEPEDVIKYLRGYDVGKPTFQEVNFETANRKGIPFLKTILKHRVLPTRRIRYCTSDAKVLTAKRKLVSIGWKYWTVIMGFRADESRRLYRNQQSKANNRWDTASPMVEDGVTAEDVGEFWKEQPFDLELPSHNGKCIYSNCIACHLKSESAKVQILQKYPKEFEWANRLEKTFTEHYGKDHFFTDKKPLESLKQYVYANPDSLNQEGAYCMEDGGDCFAGIEEADEETLKQIFAED